MQQPIVLIMVLLQKSTAPVKTLCLREVGFLADILTVDPVITPAGGDAGTVLSGGNPYAVRNLRVPDLADPAVALLTANDLPGIVSGVIVCSAILPIMQVIGN